MTEPTDRWRPLHVRESDDATRYDGPFDGVPSWLFMPLWDWVDSQMPNVWGGKTWSRSAIATYRSMAAALRTTFETLQDASGQHIRDGLYAYVAAEPDRLLSVVDWVLHHRLSATNPYHRQVLETLSGILESGGSAYEVCRDDSHHCYLGRRLTPVERAAADEAMVGVDKPARYLARAWKAVYGRDPHPSEGYALAIKAVEAAVIPVVSPGNKRATLGTVIRDLRGSPTKWRVTLHHFDESAPDRGAGGDAGRSVARTLDQTRRSGPGRSDRRHAAGGSGGDPARRRAGQLVPGGDGPSALGACVGSHCRGDRCGVALNLGADAYWLLSVKRAGGYSPKQGLEVAALAQAWASGDNPVLWHEAN